MRQALIAAMLLLASCNYSPMHPLAPTDVPIASERDLSGSWCFTSGTSRQYGTGASIPFIPQYELHEESVITLRYDGNAIVADYTSRDGTRKQSTYDIAKEDARWLDGKLVAHPGAPGNPFGWYHQTSEAKIYRLADGRLVMTASTTDTGLACALVPYREKNESVIVMRPATKGCPAPG
jgi:hypothetical protein